VISWFGDEAVLLAWGYGLRVARRVWLRLV